MRKINVLPEKINPYWSRKHAGVLGLSWKTLSNTIDRRWTASYTETKVVSSSSYDEEVSGPFHPSSVPIYQTATFRQKSASGFDSYDYTRSGNPTRDALEAVLASIEVQDIRNGYSKAFAFNSGMSAISCLIDLLGEAFILAGDDLYGGSTRLLDFTKKVTYVDTSDTNNLSDILRQSPGKFKLLLCESPTNPTMRISDIRKLAEICHQNQIIFCVDNTMMSPAIQRPLELGADIVMHSATKFLNGHGDVMAGVLATNSEELAQRIKFIQNAKGTALSPFDSWLLLRGLKTLPIRIERHQDNAKKVFEFLRSNSYIDKRNIFFPSNCEKSVHSNQASGPGSIISFSTGDVSTSVKLTEALALFKIQVSFGSTSSTAELPFFHSHASVPSHLKDGLKFPKDLIRLSIGLEHVNDIISDLDNAIKSAFNETGFTKTSTTRKLSMPTLNQRRNFSTYRGSSTTSVMGGEHKTRPPISDTLTTPIALSAAYWFKDSQELMDFATGKHNSYEYGRYGNPTTRILENKILHLESGNEKDHDCLMFASGMSASTTMFMAMVEPGGHVVTTKDCYRRTRQFIADFLPKMNISFSVLQNPGNLEELQKELSSRKCSLFFTESPTNPFLRCVNIPKAAELCRKFDTVFCVDSTFATPINQRPLELGADLVLHSATKYLAGHNDVLAGTIAGKQEYVAKIRNLHKILGGLLDPHAAYLIIRGLKTLQLRVERQNQTGMALAKALESHSLINRVHYPGLSSHPDNAFAKDFMSGYGGVVSFEIKGDLHMTSRFIDLLKIPFIAPSLGGVESLVEQPTIISYWDQTPEQRAEIGIKENLVRFSCGVEDTEDIIEDVLSSINALRDNYHIWKSEPYLEF